MKMRRASCAVAAYSMLLSACVSSLTPEEEATADFGPYPADYQQIIANYQEATYEAPSSIRMRYLGVPVHDARGPVNGWGICLLVNAKNSNGGYIGNRLVAVFIRDSKVLGYSAQDHESSASDQSIVAKCKFLQKAMKWTVRQ